MDRGLLDHYLNATITYLHDGCVARGEGGRDGGCATNGCGCAQLCACGGVYRYVGAIGKASEGDGATLGADEHGL